MGARLNSSVWINDGGCVTPEIAQDISFRHVGGALKVECVCQRCRGDCCLREPTPLERERFEQLAGAVAVA